MTFIVDNYQPKTVSFKDIEIGEIFKWNNSVYLKTNNLYSEVTNAFDLSYREECTFYKDKPVQVVKATVTIEPC